MSSIIDELKQKLNLAKGVVLNLVKDKGIEGQKANVVLCVDYSGSMDPLYKNGFVQEVLERIVPIAMAFDDDGAMPMYIFHSQAFRVLPDVTVDNVHNYVKDNIISKYSYGSTCYAPPINMIVKQFIKDNDAGASPSKVSASPDNTSFWGKARNFFGGADTGTTPASVQVTAELPTYVIFITDGENDESDKVPATQAITDASKHGIFFQKVGLRTPTTGNFGFLTKLDKMPGRFIDNVNFFEIRPEEIHLDPRHTDALLPDSAFYSKLLTEYPGWTKEAISKNLIKGTTVSA